MELPARDALRTADDASLSLADMGDDDAGDDLAAGGSAAAPMEPAQADLVDTRKGQVPESGHGLRLDKHLVTLAPEFSRSHLQTLIERGCVRLDGMQTNAVSRHVKAGQRVEVDLLPTAQSSAFRAEPMALAVVFEDEHLLVVDKPAGLVVHPAAGHWQGTLLNGLLSHHRGAAQLPRAGIVHRLDKDTSGLMVVAKTLVAQTALVRAIAAHEVRREYVALAWGKMADGPFSVDAPIGRDPVSRVRMAVVASGKAARTDVRTLASGDVVTAAGRDACVSLVVCRLHTGRTHQIRVHLLSRGHPLVADALYGGRPALGLQRQALHARTLAFDHPIEGHRLVFGAGLPNDLALAVRQLAGAVDLVATMYSIDEAFPDGIGF